MLTLSIFVSQSSIQSQVKQSHNKRNSSRILLRTKLGPPHLVRNGEEWHKVTKKTKEIGTNSIFFMNHDEIDTVTKAGRTFTYARIVVDFRPQKKDPNRVRMTAGGQLNQVSRRAHHKNSGSHNIKSSVE